MATQLSMEERELIAQMHFAGVPPAEIGRRLGRHRSSICRELARNGEVDGTYSASRAHAKARGRRRARPLVRKMDRPEINARVRRGLAQYWSPDEIAGRAKHEHPRDDSSHVSHQTIYDWIRQDEHQTHWEQFLRRGGTRKPKHDRRGKIANPRPIAGRPAVVDRRTRFGDWEGDTVVGKQHRGALITLVDRKSGYLIAAKSKDRQARRVRKKIEQRLQALPAALRRTMTFDNGKEFAEHQRLAQNTGVDVYFADPYCSWQRGTNENTNGLLRQFFPKGTDFLGVSPAKLSHTVTLLNNRPRKRLGYRTPAEVLAQSGLVAFET